MIGADAIYFSSDLGWFVCASYGHSFPRAVRDPAVVTSFPVTLRRIMIGHTLRSILYILRIGGVLEFSTKNGTAGKDTAS